MFKTLLSVWQYVAVAFASGLALGYVSAVFQFEGAVLSHADRVAATQHKQDAKVDAASRAVSVAAKSRHDAGASVAANVRTRLSAAPEKPPQCDLDQATLNLLNEASQ